MLAHVREAHGFNRFELFTAEELTFLLVGAVWAKDKGFAQPPIRLHERVTDELGNAVEAALERDSPESTPGIDERALRAVLYEYRLCSENEAREIIGRYLAALREDDVS